MDKGQNHNRPTKGQCIMAEPIRNRVDISAIRELLKDKPRDLCLFEMGIHTNLRIGDLLAITVGRVADLKPGDVIPVRQQKRGKFGLRTLNQHVYTIIQEWIPKHPKSYKLDPIGNQIYKGSAALFPGKDGHKSITIPYASRLIKSWCHAVGLTGNYSAHSLRKTFGYHAVNTFGAPVHVVSAAFGHRDISTTLLYLGIQETDVAELFMNEL